MSVFVALFRGPGFGLLLCLVPAFASAAAARSSADVAGTWDLTLERPGAATAVATCRIMLRPQQSFRGDFFLGLPVACKHAMPVVAKALRWTIANGDQLVFNDAAGASVASFAAVGDGFKASQSDGTYVLKLVGKPDGPASSNVANDPAKPVAVVQPVSKREKPPVVERERPSDLVGRYAVMRDKRDTGCMITLDDSARVKGGDRAQLAPGCRDQGIVIFDPSAWLLEKGELVLTARAGHRTVLERQGQGLWAKDAKDGGKPLGLKKL